MRLQRRDLLLGLGAALTPAAAVAIEPQRIPDAAQPRPDGDAWLKSPDLSLRPEETPRFATGVRPVRRGGFRLEREDLGAGKILVHNYGHGGGGITLSWGCAELVLKVLEDANIPKTQPVTVVGAGIIGLTTAVLLRRDGHPVTLYAKETSSGNIRSPRTTSDIAGGQWAPSINGPGADINKLTEASRRSYKRYQDLIGARRGYVLEVNNYSIAADGNPGTLDDLNMLARIDPLLAPKTNIVLPFEEMNRYQGGAPRMGSVYRTMLINVPRMITQLKTELAERGVVPVPRYFAAKADLAGLPDTVVVNCTGLGSRELCGDTDMMGRKGILALPDAMPNLPLPEQRYLFSGIGYLFPRSDVTVVGGAVIDLTDSEILALCRPGSDPFQTLPDDARRARMIMRLMDSVMRGVLPVRMPTVDWFSNGAALVSA